MARNLNVLVRPKIVHLIAGELTGGAARGAYTLHKGLLAQGIDSYVLTSSRTTLGESEIHSILSKDNVQLYAANKAKEETVIREALLSGHRPNGLFSTGKYGFPIAEHPLVLMADIVHLHWINDRFLAIGELKQIKKPIVWSLRDMWPFTGGCHYSLECNKWQRACGRCVVLSSDEEFDLSHRVLRSKKSEFPDSITYVGISQWLTDLAKKSALLQDADVRHIPNCIDLDEYFPIEKKIARVCLGIKTKKKILLIGAARLKDRYKGFEHLRSFLKLLNRDDFYLVTFGASSEQDIAALGFEYKRFGYLYDYASMRLVYSAADVFVCTSILEAFGKTVVESIACGTPVLCFDSSGPAEIVDHKVNGFKVLPFDLFGLKSGLDYLLSREFRVDKLFFESVSQFDKTRVAKKYVSLYKNII